ncbi:MAG TPA: nucleotidyltransferase family protein [Pyrinomonadaceae bacterium]|nr:nucleotidyltransferase family protein [Pyrinomonadaceae bacterium]
MTQVFAILLAAGRSRRMGALKPLLPFGENTVIRCCINNLYAGGVHQVVLVLGHRAEDVRAHVADLDLRFALNSNPESEMSDSIICGLTQIGPASGAVLIMPADYPAVGPEVINLLITEWERGSRLIIPEHCGQGGHPVLIDCSYRQELANLDPQGGLRAFFVAHKSDVQRLPIASPYIARDLDTWDDYCALHQEIFRRPPQTSWPEERN